MEKIKAVIVTVPIASDSSRIMPGTTKVAPYGKKYYFSYFVLIGITLPLLFILWEASSLLRGNQVFGTKPYEAGNLLYTVNYTLQHIVPETFLFVIPVIVIGCFSFGIISSSGGCFLVPFFSGFLLLCSLLLVSFIFSALIRRVGIAKQKKFIEVWFGLVLLIYVFLFAGNIVSKKNQVIDDNSRAASYVDKYVFTGHTISQQFIGIRWTPTPVHADKTQELYLGSFDDTMASLLRVHTFFEGPSTGSIALPSPKGDFFVSAVEISNNLEVHGTVMSTDGKQIYRIPYSFKSYRLAGGEWSPNENYLAVVHEMPSSISYENPKLVLAVYEPLKGRALVQLPNVEYGAFAWGKDNKLYYVCGSKVCTFEPQKHANMEVANSVACRALSVTSGKIYCSLNSLELFEKFGIKKDLSEFPYARGSEELNEFVISQSIQPNGSATLPRIINMAPVLPVAKTMIIDDRYILAIHDGSPVTLIDLLTGRLEKSSGNIFFKTLSATKSRVTSLPVKYEK